MWRNKLFFRTDIRSSKFYHPFILTGSLLGRQKEDEEKAVQAAPLLCAAPVTEPARQHAQPSPIRHHPIRLSPPQEDFLLKMADVGADSFHDSIYLNQSDPKTYPRANVHKFVGSLELPGFLPDFSHNQFHLQTSILLNPKFPSQSKERWINSVCRWLNMIDPLRAARASYGNKLMAVWLRVAARWDSRRNHIHLAESN